MTGRITPELKEQILTRTDILEIVGSRVALRPVGQLYKARCPFHQEKTPSFTVTPARQTYHCFGCGAHGNAIDFLIEHDRLSFPEALEELARRAGIDWPAAGAPQVPAVDLNPMFDVLEKAAALYRQKIRGSSAAIRYLKERGLSGEIAAEFGLGYAPAGWDFLLRRLGQQASDRQALLDAGLVVERVNDAETRYYDRFRDRIMFPIRDHRGRVLGFGGRVLDRSEPKYLNSPETPVFQKGRELYGLYEARQRQRRIARLLVVEGYMDVIALTQFGLPYAVATLGTATTSDQLRRLKRQTDDLVFCFDGDKAGRAAAWKALQISLPFAADRLAIRFLLLPQGHDPDSLLRTEGVAAFEARLGQAVLLSDFLFDQLREQSDLNSAEGRARCDADARALIALAPEGTYRELLLQRLESMIGIQARPRSPGRDLGRRAWPAPKPFPRTSSRSFLTALKLATALLLRNPRLALVSRDVPDDCLSMTEPGYGLLRELLAHADADPDISSARLRERICDKERQMALAELEDPQLTSHIPEAGMEEEFRGALQALCRQAEREQRYQLLSSVSIDQLSGDQNALRRRMAERKAVDPLS